MVQGHTRKPESSDIVARSVQRIAKLLHLSCLARAIEPLNHNECPARDRRRGLLPRILFPRRSRHCHSFLALGKCVSMKIEKIWEKKVQLYINNEMWGAVSVPRVAGWQTRCTSKLNPSVSLVLYLLTPTIDSRRADNFTTSYSRSTRQRDTIHHPHLHPAYGNSQWLPRRLMKAALHPS